MKRHASHSFMLCTRKNYCDVPALLLLLLLLLIFVVGMSNQRDAVVDATSLDSNHQSCPPAFVTTYRTKVDAASYIKTAATEVSCRLNIGMALLASSDDNDDTIHTNAVSADSIYLDIGVAASRGNDDVELGRLTFDLVNPSPLPLHTENVIQLCREARISIDFRATYRKCAFEYAPSSVQNSGRYGWSHILRGNGRNAVGPAKGVIHDPTNQLTATHRIFGGQYYGANLNDMANDDTPVVALAVGITGPGRGSSRISMIRVSESPPEWRERLLLNTGVIGTLRMESMDTLNAMARCTGGPPMVRACGAE